MTKKKETKHLYALVGDDGIVLVIHAEPAEVKANAAANGRRVFKITSVEETE